MMGALPYYIEGGNALAEWQGRYSDRYAMKPGFAPPPPKRIERDTTIPNVKKGEKDHGRGSK